MTIRKAGFVRPAAVLVSASMLSPLLVGCGGGGGGGSQASAPAIDRSGAGSLPPAVGGPKVNTGMSTKQKMVLLAGAAALYYMYKKQQNAKGQATQYYKSETNGRIYYRDPKTKQAIYVTPPQGGIMVPSQEAQSYNSYQGYNSSPAGQTFGGYGANGPVGGAVPQPMR